MPNVKECVLALARTVAALMKHIGRWATAQHAQQRTSHEEVELLNQLRVQLHRQPPVYSPGQQ